jgi:hypothetical protein
MKKIVYIVSLTAISLSALAQNQTLQLWPANKIPNSIPNTLEEKSETTGGIMRISSVTVPTLTAYIPPS